ncbi:hypothetical protein [Roseinatronobacter monicus]|uniref:Uncharacterized protein n=1 Tax=Roseinatronobacter monicus TaxID=393481 RepID=A0A543KC10_9RHOB|nr:hypothetical protein [Roseinatronobacter monicus]TQM92618.1 hypothetical protein BD293_1229 [Roseinatronobacter monicus]
MAGRSDVMLGDFAMRAAALGISEKALPGLGRWRRYLAAVIGVRGRHCRAPNRRSDVIRLYST